MATQINGSVVRAFEILGLVGADRSEITAPLVSKALGLNAITAHRFLKSLEQAGALVATGRGVYRLGFALLDLGSRALARDNVAEVVQPVLDSLTRKFREATMAMVFEADMVTCIAKAVSTRPLYVDIRIGSRLEAYCTAHGKVWLAHLGEARLSRYLDDMLRQELPDSAPFARDALLAELRAVRRDGYAFNLGEREPDLNAIAVPVYSATGVLVCSLSMFGPSSRLDRGTLAAAVEPMREAARSAGAALYGRPQPTGPGIRGAGTCEAEARRRRMESGEGT